MRQNTFNKKIRWVKCIIFEQIIAFELRGSEHLVEHVLLNPVVFATKQKSPKQILKRLFTAKNIAGGNYT